MQPPPLAPCCPDCSLASGSSQDVISIHKDKLPNYEEKIKSFYEEHLHTDEEIRFVLDGSGEAGAAAYCG